MNPKDQMILDEYHDNQQDFKQLKTIVDSKLKKIVDENNILPMQLESRIKTKDSLKGKLFLKGEKYKTLSDITDIFGTRVVCFFKDEVYQISANIQENFVIDWDNSIDKSTVLSEDAFGYLSVHYVCSLKPSEYPQSLSNIRFEIQLRSGLQHICAAINHETTYKSEFDVPREIKRSLSRLAGLLELADDEFLRVRDEMIHYGEDTRQKILNNEANDVQINAVSLKEYMLGNKEMRRFLNELAAIEGSEISDIAPDAYLDQLKWFGMKTLGDVQDMLIRDEQLALHLANKALSGSELDILASNVGLRYLCRAELLNRGYDLEKISDFMNIAYGDKERSAKQAQKLLDIYDSLK